MNRVSRIGLLVVLLLVSETARGELVPVPEPNLDALAGPVAERIRSVLQGLRVAGNDTATADAERGRLFGHAGQLFYANELNAAAEACLRNAALLDTAEPRWPYLLGALLQGIGRSKEAVEAYGRALALAPDTPHVRYRLVSVLLDLGRFEEAEAQLAVAGQASETFGGFAELAARLAAARGDAEEAVRQYEKALQGAPEATRLHFPLATLYRRLGDDEQADRHARMAGQGEVPIPDPWLTEVSDHVVGPQGLLVRGLRAHAAGNPEEAEEALRQAVELAPTNPQAHLNLGAVLLEGGDLAAAERHLQEALRIRPDYAEAHYNLARIAEERGDPQGALGHYRRASELAPRSTEYRLPYARLLLAARRPAQAVDELTMALRDTPADVEARFLLAVALEAVGERRQAQEAAAAALRVAPDASDVVEVYVRLTATTEGLSESEHRRALTAARRLYEDQDRSPNSADALAMALAANGRFGKAVDLQRALVEGLPESAPQPTLEHLRHNLDRYQSKLPADRPWPASAGPPAPGQ